MQSHLFRLLNNIAEIVFLSLISFSLFASDTHQTDSEASSHCQSSASAAASTWNAQAPTGWSLEALSCLKVMTSSNPPNIGYYQEKCERFYNGAHENYYNCSQMVSTVSIHYFGEIAPACQDDPNATATNWYTYQFAQTSPSPPLAVCNNSCKYNYTISDNAPCTTDGVIGSPSAGDNIQCPYTYTNSGSECTAGEPALTPSNDPNYYDCTNVDCSSDSGGSGAGGSGSGGTLPDDPNANNTPLPPGDGNPDTPGGPDDGTGTGDIDGDGERDIDCDPQSNVDCNYTGSASGVGNCDAPPICNGEPVSCALLYQQWANMCYDDGDFTNPGDCQAAFACEGDTLQCEILRMKREQFCLTFAGDGSVDLDVFNDVDFERDLKTEADVVDVAGSLDQSGFASASCPASVPISTAYGTVDISFQTMCDAASYVRVLVILSSLIFGAFIVTGVRSK